MKPSRSSNLGLAATLALALVACQAEQSKPPAEVSAMTENSAQPPSTGLQTTTFGAGCFWCVEAVLEQVDGVTRVESGYMGGHVDNPSYQQICTGSTGHAEVVQVEFDPEQLPYDKLLDWFFRLHDPTTLNRQGHDRGTQYRSVIFYHHDGQRQAAEAAKARWQESGVYADPIVTEISPAVTFWLAEIDHQDYYRLNKNKNPYCPAVIAPKLEKLGLRK